MTSINNDNWVAGNYFTADNTEVGYVRSPDGTITTINVDNYVANTAKCINKASSVTGSFGQQGGHGYVQSASGEISQIKIKGGVNIYPPCISDNGLVTGNCEVKGIKRQPKYYGFIWTP